MELEQLSKELKSRAGWFLSHQLATSVTIAAGVVAIIFVPQVNHVLFQLPGRVSSADWPYALLWFLLMTVVWFAGLSVIRLIVDPGTPEPDAAGSRWSPGRLWAIAGGLLAVALLLAVTADARDPSQSLGFARWLPLPLPIVLIAIAAWVAPVHLYCPDWLRSEQRPRMFIVLRLVVFSLGLVLIGEVVWFLAGWERAPYVSYQAYTVWAIFQVLFLLIMLGRALDGLYLEKVWWIRFGALAAVVLVAFLWRPSRVGAAARELRASDPDQVAAGITARWFEAVNERIDATPSTGPIVLVAASGGGSRAALYAALVLESFEDVTFFDHPLADRVAVISSVSGGSLASAYFADRQARGDRAARHPVRWRHTIVSDLQARVRLEAEAMLERAEARPAPTVETREDDRVHRLIVNALRRIRQAEAPVPTGVTDSEYIDHMNMDFMAPVLRSVVYAWLSRGRNLRRFWEREFGWSGRDNPTWLRPRRDGDAQAPVLLLNATLVETGERLAIGVPALPPHLLERDDAAARSLSAVDPAYRVSLAEAVRLSANFPWGIPVAKLRTRPEPIHVLDGGVVDNTGIDMLYELLAAIRHVASAGPADGIGSPDERLLRDEAGRLWDKLRQRGVFIIEIDSGAKPSRLGSVADVFPEIVNPIQALQKSSHARLVSAKRNYLEEIDRLFRPRSGAAVDGAFPLAPGMPSITYLCNDDESVMTAWALGPDDKALVMLRFLLEREINEREILARARHYDRLFGAEAVTLRMMEAYTAHTSRWEDDRATALTTEQTTAAHDLARVKPKIAVDLEQDELTRVVPVLEQLSREQSRIDRDARRRFYEQRGD
ncbi:MAG: patatin-like phospholipase family protein [Planctomycetota bacterium]|jgi:hypothetical protein